MSLLRAPLTGNDTKCGSCAISRMAPVHPFEDAIIQRLDPHAYAVDPQIQQAPYVLRTPLDNILRIHLDGELGEGHFRQRG